MTESAIDKLLNMADNDSLMDLYGEVELVADARAELATLREENEQYRETWTRALRGDGITDEEQAVFKAIFGPSLYEERRIEPLLAENARLRELLQDVLNSGVAFEDARIGYKDIQIDTYLLDEIKKALIKVSQ